MRKSIVAFQRHMTNTYSLSEYGKVIHLNIASTDITICEQLSVKTMLRDEAWPLSLPLCNRCFGWK